MKNSLIGLTAVVWASCIFSTSKPAFLPATPSGMVLVTATGRQTLLGSDDVYAKKDEESPRPTVSFTYDFFMDSTEVTQSQYQSLMGRNPATTTFGLGADYPVYNVTFYDAALFCNARSKAGGLDTVYAYVARQQDASGRTYGLPGLTIHYEQQGFRLPTEAEWEYAARGGVSSVYPWGNAFDSASAVQVAWYRQNAGGAVHPVGRLAANPFGLSDMLGNVMEWVNDWKAPYAAVPLRDFLGNRDPGASPERVIKGEAFSYDAQNLRFSSRSDVWKVRFSC